ncbi:hypothetical protein ACFL35_18210 [Candidatus Riflebacteria bacterium]
MNRKSKDNLTARLLPCPRCEKRKFRVPRCSECKPRIKSRWVDGKGLICNKCKSVIAKKLLCTNCGFSQPKTEKDINLKRIVTPSIAKKHTVKFIPKGDYGSLSNTRTNMVRCPNCDKKVGDTEIRHHKTLCISKASSDNGQKKEKGDKKKKKRGFGTCLLCRERVIGGGMKKHLAEVHHQTRKGVLLESHPEVQRKNKFLEITPVIKPDL